MVYPTEVGRQDAPNDNRVRFQLPPAPRQGEGTHTLFTGSGGERKKNKIYKITIKRTACNPSPVHPNARCRGLPLFFIYVTNKLSGCISRKHLGKDNLEISKYSPSLNPPPPREAEHRARGNTTGRPGDGGNEEGSPPPPQSRVAAPGADPARPPPGHVPGVRPAPPGHGNPRHAHGGGPHPPPTPPQPLTGD